MTNETKITWIKAGLLVFYLMTFFFPIYAKVSNGTLYKVSIVGLNAGIFFLIFFLVLIFVTVISHVLFKVYHKYIYIGMLVSMSILLFMLLFLKERASMIRIAFYLQFLTVGLLASAHFLKSQTITLFDILSHQIAKLVTTIKNKTIQLFHVINAKLKRNKDTTSDTNKGDGRA